MTSQEYHAEELKRREEKKEARNRPQIKPEKLLSISSKISKNDLDAKAKKCRKWIEKLHEVRVVITVDGDMQKAENVFNTVEKEVKEVEGRILQKREKDNFIRFTIMPLIKKPEQQPVKGTVEHEKKFLEPENLNVQQARSHHVI
jgi:translation initiation factor IF-3